MATTQSRKRRKPNIPLGSTSPTQPTCYDVFLGFFGPDTRRGFAGRLDAVLSERGVVVYRDDDYEYYGVEPINSQIRKAIESSRISIVILSRNYARSIWCLDLLKLILDCRQVNGQVVFPVFYGVYPSEVRKQKGGFGEAFAAYEQRFEDNIDKVHVWRDALCEVASLSGFWLREVGTPDFTVTPNLHRLILEGCINLVTIHPSIAELKRLIFLNLKDCRSLEHLPKRFGMESLQILILSGCSKISKVPEFVRPMENLLELYLDKTAVEELPSSIECLTGLTLLNLRDCRNLSSLASSTCQLRSLKSLNLSGCSKLEELPKNLGKMVCLKELDVGGTSINDLPSSISRLENLELLSLCGCKSMRRKKTSPLSLLLPTTDSGLLSLTVLNLSDCNLEEVTILENLGCLSSIVSLNLSKNGFVSLPKNITELSKLQILNLGGCKCLKKLPDLSAELNFSVEGKGSYSQERLSSCFSFINCFEVVDDQGCNNVAFAALRRFLEGIPYVGNKFEAIYPGNEISKWFSYRSERPVVSVELPQRWYKNEWMGYALCAVFTLRRRLPPDLLGKWNYGTHTTAHGLRCEVKPGNLGVGGWCPSFTCSEELGQIEKEHIWLSFVSGEYFGTTWQDSCHHLEFTFKTLSPGLEVKMCGVRLVYERDLVGLKQPF